MKKNTKNNANEVNVAYKKKQNKQNKSVEVVALVAMGAAILKTFEQKRKAEFYRLKIDDLVAVLTHANPRENVSKPNNKVEGQERVRALASVKVTRERHALVVAAATTHVPTPSTSHVLEMPIFSSVHRLYRMNRLIMSRSYPLLPSRMSYSNPLRTPTLFCPDIRK
jgi:hypothetical protein